MNIPIYKDEIEAGIAEQVKASASIAFLSQLNGIEPNQKDLDNAKKIGFLIDTPNANVLKIGNSALNGAIIYLVNVEERIKIESIVKSIKHVELETDENFFDHFVEGCQFKELKVM